MAEQIKEAKKQKHCPYCKGQDFNITFESSERGFCFRNDEIEWGEKDKENIKVIQCNICLEEIPIEVWIEWKIKVGE